MKGHYYWNIIFTFLLAPMYYVLEYFIGTYDNLKILLPEQTTARCNFNILYYTVALAEKFVKVL